MLLLDEPTAGMNAQETEATRQLIFAIRDLGISVVVIEHDTKFIFTLCDRVLVLVQGELLVEGTPGRGAWRPAGRRGLPRRPAGRGRGADPRRRSTAGESDRDQQSVSFSRSATSPSPTARSRRCAGSRFDGREGPDRQPDRQQRGGQDDHAAHDLRAAARRLRRGLPGRRADPPAAGARDPHPGRGAQPGGSQLFARMTVEENLRLGAYTRRDDAGIVEDMERVYSMFPVLGERRRNKAGLFSGGEQQMLAIGRALMSRPSAAHARRAVDGPLADHDAEDLRRRSRSCRRRARRSCSSSRTRSPRWRCRTTRTSSTSAARRCRAPARSCWPTRVCRRPTSARASAS